MVGLSFNLEAGNLFDYYCMRKLLLAPAVTPTFLVASGEFNEELNL
jgi:hypothetical protein